MTQQILLSDIPLLVLLCIWDNKPSIVLQYAHPIKERSNQHIPLAYLLPTQQRQLHNLTHLRYLLQEPHLYFLLVFLILIQEHRIEPPGKRRLAKHLAVSSHCYPVVAFRVVPVRIIKAVIDVVHDMGSTEQNHLVVLDYWAIL